MPEWPELALDREEFLALYWQREPLLIRDAVKNFTPPLASDELAGLALEQDVESRIIESRGKEWILHHGPFETPDFQRNGPWTLLVQAVDHYVPEVAALRQLIDFLPRWRVDDVMVSYAVDGGSVGPHFDNYDVFLLQGEGQRLWKLGQHCDSTTPLLAHESLRILRDFELRQEYLLEPGDILYVPPGIAHWGIAKGDCTTFSIGFRAPRVNHMVSRFADHVLENLAADRFYRDPALDPECAAGEIRPQDLAQALAQVSEALAVKDDQRWFGELLTEPRYDPLLDPEALADDAELLRNGATAVVLSADSKLAWQYDPEAIRVFANGQSRKFEKQLLRYVISLCKDGRLDGAEFTRAMQQPSCHKLLDYLLHNGCLYVE